LPDLVVAAVSLGMQGFPPPTSCAVAYGPYEIRVTIQNIGQASASNISVIETSTGSMLQIGGLEAGRTTTLSFPLSPGGMYTVGVDMQNAIAELNESNNIHSYIAPTPTPPLLCTPTGAPSQEPPTAAATVPGDLDLFSTALRNAVYRSLDWGEFQLTNGIYYHTPPVSQESPAIYTTRIREPVYFDDIDLDGSQDALVILDTQNGGVGHMIELAVMIDQNGSAINAATTYLGDRVVIESARVENGLIVLDMRVQGPNDGACCPGQFETWTFSFDGYQLVRLP
jgi:hypothetical protein